MIVGLAEPSRRPGARHSPTRNLLQRLAARAEHVVLFARDLAVSFTNNQAERDHRPTKTQLKISGCHRSADTARAWLAIRGYISPSSRGESHPPALTDPYVTVSRHTALVVLVIRLWGLWRPISSVRSTVAGL